MTLSSTVNSNLYTGNGSVSVYAYGFKILQSADLRVSVFDLDGVETVLTLTTDYTVSTVGNVNGGNVTLVSSGQAWLTAGNLTSGYKIFIKRKLALTQSTDIKNQGAFDAERHETRFDQFAMVNQQQQEELDRSLKLSPDISGFNATIPSEEIGSTARPLLISETGLELGSPTSGIVNADIDANAEIEYSKMEDVPDGQILVGDATDKAAPVAVTGDITISNAGVTAIASGVVVDADISASAAIAFAKLAALTSGNILVGNGSNQAASVAMSGDITISNAGVTAIGSGVVVNADVSASAAIAFSKMAALTASRVPVTDGSGFITASSVTATTLGYLDATSSIQTQLNAKMTNPMSNRADMIYGGASGTPTAVTVSPGLFPVCIVSGGNNVIATRRGPELVSYVSQNLKITAQVSANALEIILDQANANLGNPTWGVRDNTAAVSLSEGAQLVTFPATFTIPAGATMGHSNGVAGWIYIYMSYGDTDADGIVVSSKCIDDGTLVSTTAIGTGSDSAEGIYSNNVKSNVYLRRIGRLMSTQATAGTYATTPTNVALEGYFNLDRSSLNNTVDLANIDTYKGIAATPENPAAGYFKHYFKADGNLYKLNSSGTESSVGGGITELTGDVTASGSGSVVAAIGTGVIVNADVNPSAAIAYSKLALTTSLVAGDMATSFYEAGTWTPTIRGSGTAGTPTYVSRVGRFTRIGRIYIIEMNVNLTSLSGSTGDLTVSGLPVNIANAGIFPSGVISFSTIGSNIVCWGNDNTDQIRFSTVAASSYTAAASSTVASGAVIGLGLVYSI